MNDSPRRGTRVALAAALSTLAIASSLASANSSKRGFAGDKEPMITGLNASWYYTWWTDPVPAVTTAEFVPIMQNQWAVGAATQYNSNPNVKAVLGFNEPERADQANLSVAQALDLWGQTQASNKELVSPAPSDTSAGRSWLQSFMSGAATRGYRVDAVAFHWYGDTRGGASSAASFLGAVDWYHSTFNKPVWITEFGGIDWSGTNPISQATNRAFLEAAAAGLESRSYVERYAWYQWDSATRLMNDDFSLTTIGDFYTGGTIVTAGQTMDLNTRGGNTGNDVWYIRGGTVTDTGTATGHFMRRILVTGTTGAITGNDNWSIRDQYLRIDPSASLSKAGANTIDFQNMKFDNNGTLSINGGTIRMRGGVITAGAGGLVKVNAGSALALSSDSAATANNLALDVTLAGGTLRSDDNRQTLNGALTVTASSIVTAVGDLSLNQPMLGSGKIGKNGLGILRIASPSGSPARTGNMQVSAGTLQIQSIVANTSMIGSGTFQLDAAAHLVGVGTVGTGPATLNGEVSPGINGSTIGTLRFGGSVTMSPSTLLTLDAASGAVDKLATAGTATTLDGTLSFHAAATFDPAFGTAFDVLTTANGYIGRFDSLANVQFGIGKSLAVSYVATGLAATIAHTGDADLSGAVDFGDLLLVAKHYNLAATGNWADGDFSGDGNVDFADLLLLAKGYGQGGTGALAAQAGESFAADFALAQSLTPEPTAMLGLIALTPLVRRRRA